MTLRNMNKKFNKISGKLVLSVVLALTASTMLVTAAWYVIRSKRIVDSQMKDVMVPYNLYLLNADGISNLKFSVGNLHPGETKQEVICVSNKSPLDQTGTAYEISRTSEFNYQLELACTTNLPVNYTVYVLDVAEETTPGAFSVTTTYQDSNNVEQTNTNYFVKRTMEVTGENGAPVQRAVAMTPIDNSAERIHEVFGTTNTTSDIVNVGEYHSYDKDAEGTVLSLDTTIDNGQVEYDRDYYLIEVSWKDGVDFSQYTKETDLVDVIVRAIQPLPEENN